MLHQQRSVMHPQKISWGQPAQSSQVFFFFSMSNFVHDHSTTRFSLLMNTKYLKPCSVSKSSISRICLALKGFVREFLLSHNNPCFQCYLAITNFLVSHTCEIRFYDVIGQNTVHMYSYAKILKHG